MSHAFCGIGNYCFGDLLLFTRVVTKAGFPINCRKTRTYDLDNGPAFLNGIGITRQGKTFLPRRALREINGLIYLVLRGRPIDYRRIHGKVSLFKALTGGGLMNEVEKKTLARYKKFRDLQNILWARNHPNSPITAPS